MGYATKIVAIGFGILVWIASAVARAAPPLPDDYQLLERGFCRFAVPSANQGVVGELESVCEDQLRIIYQQLGVERDPSVELIDVRIVVRPDQMKEVSPPDAPPPRWSSAIAYPESNLIVLPLRHRSGQPLLDLDIVLLHELSHLALRQALNGAKVPRWFSEGIAVQQSEGSSLRRYWVLWRAARGNNLIPLSDVVHYPAQPGKINLAYAQAADFVGLLLRKRGWLGVRIAIRRMASNATFDQAISYSYKRTLKSLESEWRKGLLGRWQWLPLLTGSGLIWGLMVVLFVVSYFAVKRRQRRRMEEMEREEQLQDQAFDMVTTSHHAGSPALPLSLKKTKIRIDDDIHTLH